MEITLIEAYNCLHTYVISDGASTTNIVVEVDPATKIASVYGAHYETGELRDIRSDTAVGALNQIFMRDGARPYNVTRAQDITRTGWSEMGNQHSDCGHFDAQLESVAPVADFGLPENFRFLKGMSIPDDDDGSALINQDGSLFRAPADILWAIRSRLGAAQ